MINSSDDIQASQVIESLQQSYSNIKIFTAVPMGVLMILYFFSFATLIDKGMSGLLWFEIITSIVFLIYFVFINRAAFAILKILCRKNSRKREILALMDVTELSMKPEALSDIIESRR